MEKAFSPRLKHGDEKHLGLEFLRYSHGLTRKRIVISNEMKEALPLASATQVPLLKRQCSERLTTMMTEDYHEKSALESLPQDVLIRIICGVDHEDLRQLFNVSKSIREATVIAKQLHFAHSTPTKVKAFRTSIDFQESSELDDEIEAPNAPRQRPSHRSISRRKKLADISVALFA